MKICTKCKIELDESNFGADKGKKDGLRPDCKSCRKEVSKKYVKPKEHKIEKPKSELQLHYENKERERKEKNAKWRLDNKDKLKANRELKKEEKRIYDKEYKIKNIDVIKLKDKLYKEKNKERLKEYRDTNKEAKSEYDKQYKEQNKERIKERDRLYQQRKRLERKVQYCNRI